MTRWSRVWYRINSFTASLIDPVVIAPVPPGILQAGPDADAYRDGPVDAAPVGANDGFHPFRTTLYRGPEAHDIQPVGLTQIQADWNQRFPYDADGEY